MKAVRRRGGILWARWVAIGSLLLCLTPMAIAVSGCFTLASLVVVQVTKPDPRVIPAGEAIQLTVGQKVALRLRDGSTVNGQFRGRTLLEPETYAQRFAARAGSVARTPIALGDPLQVQLGDGRTIEAPFSGYAMRTLLLRSGDAAVPTRVPFESARSVRRAGGEVISIDSLLAADVRGELPSAEALAVDEGLVRGSITERQPNRVPFEDIVTATVSQRGKHATGIVALGVGLDLVLIAALAAAASSTWGSCSSGYALNTPPDVRWTDRPFDRVSGRFFDEPVAGADSSARRPAWDSDDVTSARETPAMTK